MSITFASHATQVVTLGRTRPYRLEEDMTTVCGTLTKLRRLRNTLNGNPRYSFKIDGRTYRSQPDSPLGGDIVQWIDDKDVTAYLVKGKVVGLRVTR